MGPSSSEPRAQVSWVLPTFNEAPIIASTVRQIREWAARTGRPVEIVIVDDGEDRLEDTLAQAGESEFVTVVRGPQRGKGAAVRDGILRTTAPIIVYCDADLPLETSDMDVCIRAVETGPAHFAVPERSWTFHGPVRTVASVVLWIVQCALVFGESRFFDTQCGFKVLRRELAIRLATEQVASGGMFDVEYLYRATQLGEPVFRTRVVQKPEIRPSKIRVLRCLVHDPLDLARIKAHHRRRGGR